MKLKNIIKHTEGNKYLYDLYKDHKIIAETNREREPEKGYALYLLFKKDKYAYLQHFKLKDFNGHKKFYFLHIERHIKLKRVFLDEIITTGEIHSSEQFEDAKKLLLLEAL